MQVWPHPGVKTSTLGIMKFTISLEVLQLYMTIINLVFLLYVRWQTRILKIRKFLTVFASGPGDAGVPKSTIHVPLVPKDASYQI